MGAKIEIYNDDGDLVSKYDAPPYDKRINYYNNEYEVREYEFRFIYGEYVPIKQEESKK